MARELYLGTCFCKPFSIICKLLLVPYALIPRSLVQVALSNGQLNLKRFVFVNLIVPYRALFHFQKISTFHRMPKLHNFP